MKFSMKLHAIMSGWSIVYIEVTGYNLHQISYFFLYRSILSFKLANSADPDEMPHYAAFHLGLHYLPKYLALLFVLYFPVNNFPVGYSWVEPRTQHSDAGEDQACRPSVSSQALYH